MYSDKYTNTQRYIETRARADLPDVLAAAEGSSISSVSSSSVSRRPSRRLLPRMPASQRLRTTNKYTRSTLRCSLACPRTTTLSPSGLFPALYTTQESNARCCTALFTAHYVLRASRCCTPCIAREHRVLYLSRRRRTDSQTDRRTGALATHTHTGHWTAFTHFPRDARTPLPLLLTLAIRVEYTYIHPLKYVHVYNLFCVQRQELKSYAATRLSLSLALARVFTSFSREQRTEERLARPRRCAENTTTYIASATSSPRCTDCCCFFACGGSRGERECYSVHLCNKCATGGKGGASRRRQCGC